MKKNIDDLVQIMASLRHPETGCVWDKEQTYQTIVPHTIEEAYEVAEVIEQNKLDELCDELGDLLFQVVFYARIAEEEKRFDFSDVVDAISQKMIRRHPHVFGDEKVESVAEQKELWDAIKKQEKSVSNDDQISSYLDGVNWHMSSVNVSKKLQNKAAKVGFDWPDWHGPVEKIHEELNELTEAVTTQDRDEIQGEVGDLLFACVNLARALDVDPEAALRKTNRKFDLRFRRMEQYAHTDNKNIAELSLDEQEVYYKQVKKDFE